MGKMGEMTGATNIPFAAEFGTTADVPQHHAGDFQERPAAPPETSYERGDGGGVSGGEHHETASDSEVVLEDPLESPATASTSCLCCMARAAQCLRRVAPALNQVAMM